MPDIQELMTRNTACRACIGAQLVKIWSFGPTPPANAFLRPEELAAEEPFFPLDVYFCKDCALLQLIDIVSPDLLFRDYVYVSSTSPAFQAHFRSFAQDVVATYALRTGSLVIDVGSNDGILLKPFQALGMQVLGIDPAVKIAAQATAEGIETLPYFFTPALARDIVTTYGHASVVTAANVFAHTNDWDSFLEACRIVLAPSGTLIIEAPYLMNLLEQKLFDTVYHEHLSYLALAPLEILFRRFNLTMLDVQRVSSHGGSIRIFVGQDGGGQSSSPRVQELLDLEQRNGLDDLDTYLQFAQEVEKNKCDLSALLKSMRAQGKVIAGYGAPAKGNTLLNYFGIGPDLISYIVDDSPWKQGLFTPGTHIPVVPPEKLESDQPDYILILAWNFAPQIMEKLQHFKARGGMFIIPVPHPTIR